jgi:hypothetical protein
MEMDSSCLIDFIPASIDKPTPLLYENSLKCKDPCGEIANEFPYIDWVRVINVCV